MEQFGIVMRYDYLNRITKEDDGNGVTEVK